MLNQGVELGLLRSDAGGFDLGAVERARLLRLATSRGLSAEAIAAATVREGDLLGRFVEAIGTPPADTYTLEEAAAASGLDHAFARRLRTAANLGEDLDETDVAAMRAVRTALDSGLPEPALLQLVRVFADSLARVADAESRLFHFYVHERLLAEGVDHAEVDATIAAATDALVGLIEPTVLYFHRKAWVRALREDVLVHLASDVAPSGPVGELPVVVLFVDLAGFTPLTEAMGDEAAADIVDRFSELVRDEAVHCDGRAAKQIGDESMLVFPNAKAAITYALHLAEAATEEAHFPALRMGAHAGAALYREGDYLGATINIAARVAGQAQRGQLVVTAAVKAAAAEAVNWEPLGERHLKGVRHPIALFAAPIATARAVDPVCGMAIDESRPVARARSSVGEVLFCSESCRESFEAEPSAFGY